MSNYYEEQKDFEDNDVCFINMMMRELFNNCAKNKGLDGCYSCNGCGAFSKWFNMDLHDMDIDDVKDNYLSLDGDITLVTPPPIRNS